MYKTPRLIAMPTPIFSLRFMFRPRMMVQGRRARMKSIKPE